MCQPLTAEGEFALVREHLEIALSQPSIGWIAFGDHELFSLLADIAAQQRDEEALRQYVPLAEESSKRYDHKLYQAIAQRARGVSHYLAGEFVEAESKLNQALDLFSDMNTRYQIGRTLFELGELAAAQTDTDKARDYFTSALAAFQSMQAVPDAVRVRSALEKLK